MIYLDLNEASRANFEFMLKEIARRLDVMNTSILATDDYDITKYQDLKLLYDLSQQKQKLSIPEMQSFLDELASLRN